MSTGAGYAEETKSKAISADFPQKQIQISKLLYPSQSVSAFPANASALYVGTTGI
jgi:hypothetical protein